MDSLLAELKERERQRGEVAAQLQALAGMEDIASLDWARIEKQLRERLRDWQGLLQGKLEVAGQMLRKLLDGRLLFKPGKDADGAYYEFEGRGRLMADVAGDGRVTQNGGVPDGIRTRVARLKIWSPRPA